MSVEIRLFISIEKSDIYAIQQLATFQYMLFSIWIIVLYRNLVLHLCWWKSEKFDSYKKVKKYIKYEIWY
jgi:hypothetical protein